MKFHRRQLVLASLVVALGAAIYLNWQFSDNHGLVSTDIFRPEREIGEARYVNSSNVPNFDDNDSESHRVSNMSSETKEYFAKAKLDRQKSRDEAVDIVKSSLSGSQIDEDSKKSALEQVNYISQSIAQETNIENLIKAKGFEECLCIIQNGECNVIISPGSLDESSIITIRDVVSSQTNIPFSKIKIVEAK